MKLKELSRIIKRRQKLINFLLLYLRPTNRIMVALSQNLDKYIALYQYRISKRHKKRYVYKEKERLSA